MKKVCLLLMIILGLGCQPVFCNAEEQQNQILINSLDSTEAVELFKESFEGNYGMAVRHGLTSEAYIGQPFSVEFTSVDFEGNVVREYLFHFPIINNGKIVSCIQLNVDKIGGQIGWAVTNFFEGDDVSLNDLNDGESYYIIWDEDWNEYAVSDSKTVIFDSFDESAIEYRTPYEGQETEAVNILEPLDIDMSFITSETDSEAELFQNARAEGKTIVMLSIEEIGGRNDDGRILLPMRKIAEELDCVVSWDNETKTAAAEKDGVKAEFPTGEDYYILNGEKVEVDVGAELYNDTTYIPVRYVSEALGAEVAYNGDTKMITIAY